MIFLSVTTFLHFVNTKMNMYTQTWKLGMFVLTTFDIRQPCIKKVSSKIHMCISTNEFKSILI